MSWNALILAGTRPGGDPLAAAEDVEAKALIEIDGRTMLERVVGALREAGAGRIAVACAGAVADLAETLGCEVVAPASGPSGSAMHGLDLLGAPMLLTTADHALLEADWVRQMVQDTPDSADVSVMLAERSTVERSLPGSKRTWLKFADGQWSGCNLFYFRTDAAFAAIELWSRIEADRKRPWRIVRRLGPTMLWVYARGKLGLAEGLARLGQRIGIEVALVPANDGLAAVDADTPQDLAQIRKIFRKRQ